MFDDTRTDANAVADVRRILHGLVRRVCERVPPDFLSDAERMTVFVLFVAIGMNDPGFASFMAGLPVSAQRTVFERVPLTLAAIPCGDAIH